MGSTNAIKATLLNTDGFKRLESTTRFTDLKNTTPLIYELRSSNVLLVNEMTFLMKKRLFIPKKFKISINGLDGLSEINLMSLKLNIWILGSMDKKFNQKNYNTDILT